MLSSLIEYVQEPVPHRDAGQAPEVRHDEFGLFAVEQIARRDPLDPVQYSRPQGGSIIFSNQFTSQLTLIIESTIFEFSRSDIINLSHVKEKVSYDGIYSI